MLNSRLEQQELDWGKRTWIGLHRDSSDKRHWLWIDGSLAVDLDFNPNGTDNWNGTEDCVEWTPWKWNDLSCNQYRHYSCELSQGGSRYAPSKKMIQLILYTCCCCCCFFFFKVTYRPLGRFSNTFQREISLKMIDFNKASEACRSL